MSNDKKHILIVWETTFQSWLNDASTYAMALALIAPGYFLGSSAMQWLGVLVFFIGVMTHSGRKNARATIAEARKRLDEIEAGLK